MISDSIHLRFQFSVHDLFDRAISFELIKKKLVQGPTARGRKRRNECVRYGHDSTVTASANARLSSTWLLIRVQRVEYLGRAAGASVYHPASSFSSSFVVVVAA